MRTSLSLIRREFAAYFLGPLGYVALALFLLGGGVLFRFTVDLLTAEGAKGIEYPMQGLVGNVGFWLVFWVIPPLLTMRLFAEERATGTLEMLLTAPIQDSRVVICKYLACLLFYILLWLPTLLFLPVLLDLHFAWPGWSIGRALVAGSLAIPVGLVILTFSIGSWRPIGSTLFFAGLASWVAGIVYLRLVEKSVFCPITPGIDPMPAAAAYVGLFGSGAMFLALGLWVSSLVKNPIVAALVALAVNLAFILGGLLVLGGFYVPPADTGDAGFRVMSFLSVPLHVSQDFARGIIDTRHLLLYGSVTLAGLFLTVRSLERRRWQ
ncbi:MAG: ABC transporter permease [Gemmataceae bacterium]|nr:ABC transporter permease [Gemmataceae bacterium]